MVRLEDAVMEIIINAGQSRSLCFEALHAARQGNIDEAKSLLREADGYARQAHKMQTKLIEQVAQPYVMKAKAFVELIDGARRTFEAHTSDMRETREKLDSL